MNQSQFPFRYTNNGNIEFDRSIFFLLLSELDKIVSSKKKEGDENNEKIKKAEELIQSLTNQTRDLQTLIQNKKLEIDQLKTDLQSNETHSRESIEKLIKEKELKENEYKKYLTEKTIKYNAEIEKFKKDIEALEKMKTPVDKPPVIVEKEVIKEVQLPPITIIKEVQLPPVVDNTKVNELQKELDKFLDQNQKFQNQIHDTQRELILTKERIMKKDEEILKKTKELENLKMIYENTVRGNEEKLQKLQTNYQLALADVKVKEDEILKGKGSISSLNNDLEIKKKELEKIQDEMKKENQKFISQIQSLEEQFNIVHKNSNDKIDTLTQENGQLILDIEKLKSQADELIRKDLNIVKKDEELFRILLERSKPHLEDTLVHSIKSLENQNQKLKMEKDKYGKSVNKLFLQISENQDPIHIVKTFSRGIPPFLSDEDFAKVIKGEKTYPLVPNYATGLGNMVPYFITQNEKLIHSIQNENLNFIFIGEPFFSLKNATKIALKGNQLRFDGLKSDDGDSDIGTYCFDYTYFMSTNLFLVDYQDNSYPDGIKSLLPGKYPFLLGMMIQLLHGIELAERQFDFIINKKDEVTEDEISLLKFNFNSFYKNYSSIHMMRGGKNSSSSITLTSEHFHLDENHNSIVPSLELISSKVNYLVPIFLFENMSSENYFDEKSNFRKNQKLTMNYLFQVLFLRNNVTLANILMKTGEKLSVQTLTKNEKAFKNFQKLNMKFFIYDSYSIYPISRESKYNDDTFLTDQENPTFEKSFYKNGKMEYELKNKFTTFEFYKRYFISNIEIFKNMNFMHLTNEFILDSIQFLNLFDNETKLEFIISFMNRFFMQFIKLDLSDKGLSNELVGHWFILVLSDALEWNMNEDEMNYGVSFNQMIISMSCALDMNMELIKKRMNEENNDIIKYKLFTKYFYFLIIEEFLDNASNILKIMAIRLFTAIVYWELYDLNNIPSSNRINLLIQNRSMMDFVDTINNGTCTSILDQILKKNESLLFNAGNQSSSSSSSLTIGRKNSYQDMKEKIQSGEEGYEFIQ